MSSSSSSSPENSTADPIPVVAASSSSSVIPATPDTPIVHDAPVPPAQRERTRHDRFRGVVARYSGGVGVIDLERGGVVKVFKADIMHVNGYARELKVKDKVEFFVGRNQFNTVCAQVVTGPDGVAFTRRAQSVVDAEIAARHKKRRIEIEKSATLTKVKANMLDAMAAGSSDPAAVAFLANISAANQFLGNF